MLSPRSVTILALVAVAAAHPAFLPPPYMRPATTLTRTELEDIQPWIKFPLFGNVLQSLPNYFPTVIPEAAPKIENDDKKFQVIINVKEYKKEFLKAKLKGSFIIIQGAHADVSDNQGSIDSQFIQTYSLPLKAIPSGVTATLTSDGYLVVTAPIGNVINKVTYNEKEVPITESGELLVKEKSEEKSNVSPTPSTPAPVILVTPSVELLPPKPTNDEAVNIAYLTPTIPAISLLPPRPSEESIPSFVPAVPTSELLPPKQSSDSYSEPIVIPVPLGQVENNADNTNNASPEKQPDEEVVAPTIISLPLQPQSEVQQIVIGPTYETITNIQESTQAVQSNEATQPEAVDDLTTETISLFNEPIRGHITINQPAQEIPATEQTLTYTSSDINTSAPLEEKKLEVTEKSETVQLRNEGIEDYTTETSSLEGLGPADVIASVLRSDIVIEHESYTGEPELIKAEELIKTQQEPLNEEGSIKSAQLPESLSEQTTEAADSVAITEQQALLHKDDESELIVESATAAVVRSDLNQNEVINESPTEINSIPADFARSQESQNTIGAENVVEDSTLSENLPSADIAEPTVRNISSELLASIANVVYDEVFANQPKTEVKEPETIIPSETATDKTSEVSEN